MGRKFPTAVVLVTAFIYFGFAGWLGADPGVLLTIFGIEESTPQMLTEFRAFYGGIEFGIGAAMLLLWWRGDAFAAALIGGLPLAGSVSGRLVGQFLDGYSGLHLVLAMPEAIGAAMCFAACWQLSVGCRAMPIESGNADARE